MTSHPFAMPESHRPGRPITRAVVSLAVLVYLLAVGCALMPAPMSARAQSDDAASSSGHTPSRGEAAGQAAPGMSGKTPFRAVGMQIQRVDWLDKYKQSIDEIADLGAGAVKLVVDARQEDGTATRIYLDMRMTPTPDMLGQLIRHAKGRGLRVILMPIVLLDDPKNNEWRGTLKPESWDKWFDSYREIVGHFAWIAQANDVDLLVVGSELVSSETREAQWRQTIRHVRGIYKGPLTYSSNWDHYTVVPFWDDLDLIGMNSYWKLGKDHTATVDEIRENWAKIQKDVLAFARQQGKPVILLEVGWCSLANAAHEPWDYTPLDVPVDLDLQKRLYQGFFESWWGNPQLGGFSVWEWPPGDGGRLDRGYTPENKPAEAVLRQWLARPAWEVAPQGGR